MTLVDISSSELSVVSLLHHQTTAKVAIATISSTLTSEMMKPEFQKTIHFAMLLSETIFKLRIFVLTK